VSDQVSYPGKTKDKIIVPYIIKIRNMSELHVAPYIIIITEF
jgi:hypothetical protein